MKVKPPQPRGGSGSNRSDDSSGTASTLIMIVFRPICVLSGRVWSLGFFLAVYCAIVIATVFLLDQKRATDPLRLRSRGRVSGAPIDPSKKHAAADIVSVVGGHSLSSPRVLRTIGNSASQPNTSNCPAVLSDVDIRTTLVVQTTPERFWVMTETCQRWKDPIVAVVGLRAPHQESETHLKETLAAGKYEVECAHLKVVKYFLDDEQTKPENYPMNLLRNVGLDAVETSHVLISDIDLVPSQNLDEMIRTTIREHQQQLDEEPFDDDTTIRNERMAMVVPAFERFAPCERSSGLDCDFDGLKRYGSSFLPRAFEEIRHCVKDKSCDVAKKRTNPKGHSSTETFRWLQGQWYVSKQEDDDTVDVEKSAGKEQQQQEGLNDDTVEEEISGGIQEMIGLDDDAAADEEELARMKEEDEEREAEWVSGQQLEVRERSAGEMQSIRPITCFFKGKKTQNRREQVNGIAWQLVSHERYTPSVLQMVTNPTPF